MAILQLLSGLNSSFSDFLAAYGVSHLQLVAALIGVYIIGNVIYSLFLSPYRNIPGSLISRFGLWKMKLQAIRGTFGDTCESDYYTYGDIYVSGEGAVVISNPNDCKRVLGSHQFIKSEFYQAFAQIDDTIFTTQSAELTQLRRRQIGPAFTWGYLAGMEPTILECGILALKEKWDGLLAKAADGQTIVNYALDFSLTTFDVIGALGYGQRFHGLRENRSNIIQWLRNYNKLAVCHVAIPFASKFPFSIFTKGLVKNKEDFVAFGNQAAERRREMLRSGSIEKPKDILQALIDAEDPESKIKMTQTQITAENIGIIDGGTDTTSLTMTWTLHYLMLYPDAYRRAVDEVRSTFAYDHLIAFNEGRSKLPFVEACIYESMRIRAVSGVFLPRIVPKGGATFQGHFLPEGTQVGVNIAGMHHHQGTWDNPRRFMPERFIGNEKAKQNVVAFSTGVRICPGRNLAWIEMITIVANLLKDYDFALPEDSLFRPDRVDSFGNPVVMPRTHTLTVGPKCSKRDCKIVVSRAAPY